MRQSALIRTLSELRTSSKERQQYALHLGTNVLMIDGVLMMHAAKLGVKTPLAARLTCLTNQPERPESLLLETLHMI